MSFQVHPTDDHVLNLLANIKGLIGDYVRAFPGEHRTDIAPRWIEDWFSSRSSYYLNDPSQDRGVSFDVEKLVSEVLSRQVTVVKKPVTILSIWPHYFRGFRNLPSPINLTGKLVVIDGRNSSGKTSLAEAFEWLLSGQLVRRSLNDMGDSKELENCIGNQLRPENEQTWVEAEFMATGGERIRLKRMLTRDYGEKKSANAESTLYLNDTSLSSKEEISFFDELLAGIPPVLMQHSLRTFVSSTPSQRRNYFERLLRLDELAHLIEKSVIGDARLPEFVSQTGSVVWKGWEELKSRSQPSSAKQLKKGEKISDQQPELQIEKSLREFARGEFGINDANLTLEEIRRDLEATQKQQREKGFPLLEVLRPQKVVDQHLLDLFSKGKTESFWNEIEQISLIYAKVHKATEKIGEAQMAVAKALDELSNAGIIVDSTDAQTCPLCEFQAVSTLTPSRIAQITSWQPIMKADQEAKEKLDGKVSELRVLLDELVAAKNGLLPDMPQGEDWEKSTANVNSEIREAASACRSILSASLDATKDFNEAYNGIFGLLSQDEIDLDVIQAVGQLLTKLQLTYPVVVDKAQEYLDGFRVLENAIGKQARGDPSYNIREMWLSVSGKREELLGDLKWEKAKKSAQKELEHIRGALVSVREKLIESRRTAFSYGMTAIWGKLRSDKYSTFSRLFIPPAKGKGLPLEIEVKAVLDDGQITKEVDALRVFSESQINILGIAAFATRSKLLGHRLLILDDPVQSMDEDHFKTFCSQLLPELLGEDNQIIILTHNETFARELSFCWDDSEIDYFVTMKIDHTRKQGCTVEEGNRRVSERLKRADKYAEDGDLEKAWIAVRKAIERLYTLVRIKHGEKGFDHFSWRNATAEDMWNQGVKDIITAIVPDATKRLGEILSMTAAAAHDKKPYGSTDLLNATSFIRQLTPKLRIGG